MIPTSILFDLDVAHGAKLNKVGVLHSPALVLVGVLALNAVAAALLEHAIVQLLLAAVGIYAEAVLLGEVAAAERARVKFTVELKASEGLVEGELIEFRPGGLNYTLKPTFRDNKK